MKSVFAAAASSAVLVVAGSTVYFGPRPIEAARLPSYGRYIARPAQVIVLILAAVALMAPDTYSWLYIISVVLLTVITVACLEVARQIRRRSPRLPIVFMSAYYDQAVAEAAHLDITSTILQKPFAMADLVAHLRAVYDVAR